MVVQASGFWYMEIAVAMAMAGQCRSMSWRDARLERQREWGKRGGKGTSQGCDRYCRGLEEESFERGRKFYGKRRVGGRSVPRAPYNDSSFLMKVRRGGGLASPVLSSSSPVLSSPLPRCASYKMDAYDEAVMDQNDYGYGSMTGLIHCRSVEDEDGLNGSVVENTFSRDVHVEHAFVSCADSVTSVEQRLDEFEMAPLPERAPEDQMEQRTMRQDVHIAHLEDENLVLKERLFLVEQDVGKLWQILEGGGERCSVDENDDTQSFALADERIADAMCA